MLGIFAPKYIEMACMGALLSHLFNMRPRPPMASSIQSYTLDMLELIFSGEVFHLTESKCKMSLELNSYR